MFHILDLQAASGQLCGPQGKAALQLGGSGMGRYPHCQPIFQAQWKNRRHLLCLWDCDIDVLMWINVFHHKCTQFAIWPVDSHENYFFKFCHQMSDFKAKMHQIRLWLGLRPSPRTPLGELTALYSPRSSIQSILTARRWWRRRRKVELDPQSVQWTTLTLTLTLRRWLKVKIRGGELERVTGECRGVELTAKQQRGISRATWQLTIDWPLMTIDWPLMTIDWVDGEALDEHVTS